MVSRNAIRSFVNLILFLLTDVLVRPSSVYYGGHFDISRSEIALDFDVSI